MEVRLLKLLGPVEGGEKSWNGGVGRGSLSSLCKLFIIIKEITQAGCRGFAFVRPEPR
jgi:hypothetical protein